MPPSKRHPPCYGGALAHLDAIGVIVSDMEKAVAFYERLGLNFVVDPLPENQGHVEATLSGGLRLMLDTEAVIGSFDPEWSPPAGGPRIALAFLCESPTDVDRVYRDLLAAGASVRKDPWDAPWGQRYAQLKDPDGNVIDLFAPAGD